jgi:DNA replication protein DnaC
MGYSSIEKSQAGMFFDLMRARHIITTQLGFEEWSSFLNNPHLTAALIDRISVNCTVFNIKNSISLREKEIEQGTTED